MIEAKPSSTMICKNVFEYSELIKEIKYFDCIGSLMELQRLCALMKNQSEVNLHIKYEFHKSAEVEHKILLTRHCISFLAKQIILNCGDLFVRKESYKKFDDLTLINFVHKYNNLKTDLNEVKKESKDQWLWVLRATNLQWYYLRIPVTIMARYYYIFTKLLEKKHRFKKLF